MNPEAQSRRHGLPGAWNLLEAMLRLRGVCWALSLESDVERALLPGKKVGNESCRGGRESSELQGDHPTSASPFPASVRSAS